jgi:threonine/homoserine/homoserine lactone efflux protein
MEYLPSILAAYTVMIVAVMSPGPAIAMLMGLAFGRGRAAAVWATCGIGAGSITNGTLSLIGLGLLMQEIAWAVTVLKLVGAAYLLWLAWGSMKKAMTPPQLTPQDMPPLSPIRAFVTGYLMQITNPKALIFWVVIASVSNTATAPLTVQVPFILGAACLSFAGHMAYALALSTTPVRNAYQRARRGVEATLGLLFTFFAFKLATARS